MSNPAQVVAHQRRAEILELFDKIGGPVEVHRLMREYQLLGSSFHSTENTNTWVNSAKAALFDQYPLFAKQLNDIFPGAYGAGEFIADLTASLGNYTFLPGDAIPLLSVCRDEITRPLVDAVESVWGNSFQLGSIAGMIFTGTTGLGAGIHHAPDIDEVERFFVLTCPHVAISDQGVVGKVRRPGVPTISTACGALVAFYDELQNGTAEYAVSGDDLEQTTMKNQMHSRFQYTTPPTLEDLTKDAEKLMRTQLQKALSTFKFAGVAEYAVVSGVQVHGPDASTFFWPTEYYVMDPQGNRIEPGFEGFGQGLGAAYYEKVSAHAF